MEKGKVWSQVGREIEKENDQNTVYEILYK